MFKNMRSQKAQTTYYSRLNEYFPAVEMKHPLHLESLLESEPYYHKQETDDYLLLYARFPKFVFVDYLLVSGTTRGSGVGSRVIRGLQKDGRPILLEVEKVSDDDPDTAARRRFYKRHGFHQVEGLRYQRKDDDGNPFKMDILAWAPGHPVTADQAYRWMQEVCRTVHNHKAVEFYDALPADPEKVLAIVAGQQA